MKIISCLYLLLEKEFVNCVCHVCLSVPNKLEIFHVYQIVKYIFLSSNKWAFYGKSKTTSTTWQGVQARIELGMFRCFSVF